jgi:hypothetical protein
MDIHTAAWHGSVDAVLSLCQEDGRLASEPDRSPDGGGYTPLHYAAYNGHLDVVHALLRLGVQINARNDAGATPLFLAAQQSHAAAVRALVAVGADPLIRCAVPGLAYSPADVADSPAVLSAIANGARRRNLLYGRPGRMPAPTFDSPGLGSTAPLRKRASRSLFDGVAGAHVLASTYGDELLVHDSPISLRVRWDVAPSLAVRRALVPVSSSGETGVGVASPPVSPLKPKKGRGKEGGADADTSLLASVRKPRRNGDDDADDDAEGRDDGAAADRSRTSFASSRSASTDDDENGDGGDDEFDVRAATVRSVADGSTAGAARSSTATSSTMTSLALQPLPMSAVHIGVLDVTDSPDAAPQVVQRIILPYAACEAGNHSYALDGLRNGRVYVVKVRCTNALGHGRWSQPSAPVLIGSPTATATVAFPAQPPAMQAARETVRWAETVATAPPGSPAPPRPPPVTGAGFRTDTVPAWVKAAAARDGSTPASVGMAMLKREGFRGVSIGAGAGGSRIGAGAGAGAGASAGDGVETVRTTASAARPRGSTATMRPGSHGLAPRLVSPPRSSKNQSNKAAAASGNRVGDLDSVSYSELPDPSSVPRTRMTDLVSTWDPSMAHAQSSRIDRDEELAIAAAAAGFPNLMRGGKTPTSPRTWNVKNNATSPSESQGVRGKLRFTLDSYVALAAEEERERERQREALEAAEEAARDAEQRAAEAEAAAREAQPRTGTGVGRARSAVPPVSPAPILPDPDELAAAATAARLTASRGGRLQRHAGADGGMLDSGTSGIGSLLASAVANREALAHAAALARAEPPYDPGRRLEDTTEEARAAFDAAVAATSGQRVQSPSKAERVMAAREGSGMAASAMPSFASGSASGRFKGTGSSYMMTNKGKAAEREAAAAAIVAAAVGGDLAPRRPGGTGIADRLIDAYAKGSGGKAPSSIAFTPAAGKRTGNINELLKPGLSAFEMLQGSGALSTRLDGGTISTSARRPSNASASGRGPSPMASPRAGGGLGSSSTSSVMRTPATASRGTPAPAPASSSAARRPPSSGKR